MARLRSLWLWAPPLLYMAAIFWMSSQSDPVPGLSLSHGRDKIAHAAAYGLLAFLLARAFLATWPRHRPVLLAGLGALCAALYGAFDEIHQSFVPGRHATVGDGVANTVGAVLGAWVMLRLGLRRGRPAGGDGE